MVTTANSLGKLGNADEIWRANSSGTAQGFGPLNLTSPNTTTGNLQIGNTTLPANTVTAETATCFFGSDFAAHQGWALIPRMTNGTVTSNATVANDAILQFPLSALAATYNIEIVLFVTSTSATPGFKFSINGPGSPTAVEYRYITGTGSTLAGTTSNSYGITAAVVIPANGKSVVKISVTIVNPAANSGTFALQWSQAVSNATATTLLAGSSLRYTSKI